MVDESYIQFELTACRELMANHPESLHIQKQVETLERSLPHDPGTAVSFCRTIIETTCKTILTDRNIPVEKKWKAPKLWAEAQKCLNLGQHENGDYDKRLNTASKKVVDGLTGIIEGVVTIRNDYGLAAHGPDAYAPMLDESYALILARATDAVVGLIFKTHLKHASKDPLSRFQYGEHQDFDEWVDNETEQFIVLDTPLAPSEAFYRTDFKAYRAALVQFKQDQQTERERLLVLLRTRHE